jgi:hypothetical protein
MKQNFFNFSSLLAPNQIINGCKFCKLNKNNRFNNYTLNPENDVFGYPQVVAIGANQDYF